MLFFWDGYEPDEEDGEPTTVGFLWEFIHSHDTTLSGIGGKILPQDASILAAAQRLVKNSTNGLLKLTKPMFDEAIHVYTKPNTLQILVHIDKDQLPSTEDFGFQNEAGEYRMFHFDVFFSDAWQYNWAIKSVGKYFSDYPNSLVPVDSAESGIEKYVDPSPNQ